MNEIDPSYSLYHILILILKPSDIHKNIVFAFGNCFMPIFSDFLKITEQPMISDRMQNPDLKGLIS